MRSLGADRTVFHSASRSYNGLRISSDRGRCPTRSAHPRDRAFTRRRRATLETAPPLPCGERAKTPRRSGPGRDLRLDFGTVGFQRRVLTRLPRARLKPRVSLDRVLDRSFHSPSASESLSFASPLRRRSGANGEAGPEGAERRMRGVKESNQRKGDPGIRADRALPARCPAVLGGHRPANNSAIHGLKQFAFPRCPAPLLGASAGDPKIKVDARAFGAQRQRGDFACVAGARRMRADRGPYAAARGRRKGPKGGRHGCRPVRCQRRDALSANPGAPSRSRRAGCPETAASGCPFSWLLLFGQAKRSNPRAARRAESSNRHHRARMKHHGKAPDADPHGLTQSNTARRAEGGALSSRVEYRSVARGRGCAAVLRYLRTNGWGVISLPRSAPKACS